MNTETRRFIFWFSLSTIGALKVNKYIDYFITKDDVETMYIVMFPVLVFSTTYSIMQLWKTIK